MFFDVFPYVFEGDALFLKNQKPNGFYIDYGRSTCCYFVGFLEIHVFNEFLLGFQWKSHVHWWSPRAKNSGNPCANMIIIVFFVFSIVWNLEINEKLMKCRSPFNVTKVGIGKSCFSRLALELIYKAFRRFSGSLPCSRDTHWQDPRVLATGSVGPP